ncbi:MAG: ferredoxin family protein [Thermodesulfovibrionales bacterium]|nr:ferredoxin family protein [Thermodesulfovibrionales bacterium]
MGKTTKKNAKGKIVIDIELCKGCKYCAMACPKGCISMSRDFNSMGYFVAHFEHPEKCTGCAVCAQMCPEIAIEVWKE